jgi:hypothetical protein
MSTSNLIIPKERAEKALPDQPPTVTAGNDSATVMQIVERMMREPTFDPDKIQKMLDLKTQWDATEARKAFAVAMAAFKANPPHIVKNKHVRFVTQKGVMEYDHATHSEVTEKIAAGLCQYGMFHRWNVQQSDGRIQVTCIITHALGHSEQVQMTASADASGTKNEIQAIASTVTYLQRYTVLAATGLTSADMDDSDDDGAATGGKPDRVSEEQIANLEALITETSANKAMFLKYIKVENLSDILASNYTTAVQLLESKRRRTV